MSITAETAKEHAKDPAVLCCRAEGGITIQAANLEDPAIFDDLVDSGLLNLEGALTIEQVLGATLVKTCDSLTPLTADLVEGANVVAEAPVEEEEEAAPVEASAAAPAQVCQASAASGILKIHIGEGKDINIELPVGFNGGAAVAEVPAQLPVQEAAPAVKEPEPKVVRSVTRKHYKITEVKRGPETKIEGTTLYIREGIEEEAVASQELVHSLKIDIITPDMYHTYSETIMDVQPIAAKEGDDEIGSGTTRVLDGVVMMVTYQFVDGSDTTSYVAFYNFGDVGQNEDDRIVSGYKYEGVVVPQIQYLDNNRSVALKDNGFTLYQGSQIPKETKTVEVDKEIVSTFLDNDMIGLVFKNDSKDKQYTMEVYTTDGNLKFTQDFNIPYTTIKLSGGNILMYNSSQMCVMNSRGVQKYLGSVDGTIKDFFKIGWNRYLLVLDSGVDVIKLS